MVLAQRGVVQYAAAALVGLIGVWSVFPAWALLGHLPTGEPTSADFEQHVVGQLYFLAQRWSWPLLVAKTLNQPAGGTNIALTDSIPLLAIAAKLLQPLLPGVRQWISIDQAAAWLLQPVAAVFAVRSAGERRFVPTLAAALLAASMPTFLFRLWHAALGGQYVLLIQLGLVLRAVRGSRAALILAALLATLLLLVHPYLMVMALALLASIPLTLAARRQPLAASATALAAAALAIVLLGWVLGYWSNDRGAGYGLYSMNLASPIWPAFSGLVSVSPAAADATGGQLEGYQYVGLGMVRRLGGVARAERRPAIRLARRHPGLLAVCAGLTALAVTNQPYLFHLRLLSIRVPTRALEELRASGRLFWPCAYALLVGAVVLIALRPRLGYPVLLAAAALQTLDAAALRSIDRQSYRFAPPDFDAARLAAVIARHRRLTVLPAFPCGGATGQTFMNVLWTGAPSLPATNTMYVARRSASTICMAAEVLTSRVAADEVRVIMPGQGGAAAVPPEADQDCRLLRPYTVCTLAARGLEALPAAPPPPLLPQGATLPTRVGGQAAAALVGWWGNAGEGDDSDGPDAWIVFRVPAPAAGQPPLRLTLELKAPAVRRAQSRTVTVTSAGRPLATWQVDAAYHPYRIDVPAELIPHGQVVLRLQIADARRASSQDPRIFGIEQRSLRIDTPPPSPAQTAARRSEEAASPALPTPRHGL